MAVTTPDEIFYPDGNQPFTPVQSMGAMAASVQMALNRRGNLYVGTAAQRAAFTTAPEGVHWQDTDGAKSVYVRQGTSWVTQRASHARIFRTSDQILTKDTSVGVTFQSTEYDVGGIAELANNGIRTDKAGTWLISGQASFSAKDTLDTIDITLNGRIVIGSVVKGTLKDTATRLSTSGTMNLPAGSLITMNARGYTTNTSDCRIYGTSNWNTWLAASYLGP